MNLALFITAEERGKDAGGNVCGGDCSEHLQIDLPQQQGDRSGFPVTDGLPVNRDHRPDKGRRRTDKHLAGVARLFRGEQPLLDRHTVLSPPAAPALYG